MDMLLPPLMMLIVLGFGDCRDVDPGSFPDSIRRTRSAQDGGDDDCTRSLRVRGGEEGVLTSPNFPAHYPSATDCRWLLTVEPPNATLLIRIDALDLERDPECRLDYLQVYLGSSALTPALGPPLCGSVRGRLLRSNSSSSLLVFHSDPTHQDRGFSVRYYAQTTAPGCRELLTAESGTVASPGHPSPYPDSADCWTLVRVAEGRTLTLTFDSLDLEYGDNCTFDYVRVFDGETTGSPQLVRACGSPPPALRSSSNSLLVHFHSDASVARKGYSATYTSADQRRSATGGCLRQISEGGVGGTVASPNHPSNYPSHSNCSLWIVGPEGARVHLVFEALQLEMEPGCPFDFLQIEEPAGCNATSGGGGGGITKVLGRFCGNEGEPRNLSSTRNELRIVFQSDDFAEFSGFKLRYSFELETTPEGAGAEDRRAPPLSFAVVPRNATLKSGSSHAMHCATLPPARIRWWKDGSLLVGGSPLPGLKRLTDDTLWIRSMDGRLTGTYACAATVDGDREITATAHLRLMTDDGPTDSEERTCGIVFRKSPSDVSVVEGDFLQLECQAAGRQVRTQWRKDGRVLGRKGVGRRTTVLSNGYLFVDGATAVDAGVYECVAREEEGGCERKASALVQVTRRISVEEVCGRPSAEPSQEVPQSDHGKIMGGHTARKGAHPWQAMLWEPSLESFCGGALLSDRWLVTAAHCFVNYRNLRRERVVVRLGAHDRLMTQDKGGDKGEEFRTGVAELVVHPAYDRNTFDNDLALVRLRDPVPFSDRVLPVCLGQDESLLLGGSSPRRLGTVVGWGKLKEDGPSPRYLQEIRLPVVEQETCRASTNYTVTRNMFCAGYAQEILGDACHGDSGGPFLVTEGGRWYLVGVVSWGEGCGKRDKYGFYTRLPNYAAWIRAIVKS